MADGTAVATPRNEPKEATTRVTRNFYNHTRRLHLEKLLCLEFSQILNGHLIQVAVNLNGRYMTVSEVKRLQINL